MSLITLISIIVLIVTWFIKWTSVRKDLPPGPWGLPLIGHLHHLIHLPHQSLHHLSRKYGPVMSIKLGNKTAIVVSSKQAAKEVLTSFDKVFASRPCLISPESLCYGSRDIACCEYGPYWRQMKKLCMTHLFTAKRLEDFRSIRLEETLELLRDIASNQARPVDMKSKLSMLTFNVITRMTFTKRFYDRWSAASDPRFVEVILEAVSLMGAVNIGDYIPWLSWLDLGGYHKRLEKTSKEIDEVLQRLIDQHREAALPLRDDPGDLIHTFLSLGVDDKSMKGVILDILAGGTDTTAVTTEWALSELIRNPGTLQELRQEIQNIVGDERLVEESDLQKLHYLRAVIKETFRLHPAAPLMAPHESIDDCELQGYKIPRKTWLMVNLWSLGRDPRSWESPEAFKPERFLGSSIDVKGNDFELIPFGSGRRICAGMSLALIMVGLTLARLVQAFDWSLPGNEEMNMEESQGVIMRRRKPLVVSAKWRLNMQS
ncbi:cytochrome P450 71A1 [Selaginella moellendorffii]|nr:cytochrome P450 71A1 [Selaginella moellendorffii]|eukprot:XP_002989019.2 cytochrome P450 71A1 [Selaginella moellendorffii]